MNSIIEKNCLLYSELKSPLFTLEPFQKKITNIFRDIFKFQDSNHSLFKDKENSALEKNYQLVKKNVEENWEKIATELFGRKISCIESPFNGGEMQSSIQDGILYLSKTDKLVRLDSLKNDLRERFQNPDNLKNLKSAVNDIFLKYAQDFSEDADLVNSSMSCVKAIKRLFNNKVLNLSEEKREEEESHFLAQCIGVLQKHTLSWVSLLKETCRLELISQAYKNPSITFNDFDAICIQDSKLQISKADLNELKGIVFVGVDSEGKEARLKISQSLKNRSNYLKGFNNQEFSKIHDREVEFSSPGISFEMMDYINQESIQIDESIIQKKNDIKELDFNSLIDFLYALDYLQIDDFKERCVDAVVQNVGHNIQINSDNVLKRLYVADDFGIKKLKQATIDFLVSTIDSNDEKAFILQLIELVQIEGKFGKNRNAFISHLSDWINSENIDDLLSMISLASANPSVSKEDLDGAISEWINAQYLKHGVEWLEDCFGKLKNLGIEISFYKSTKGVDQALFSRVVAQFPNLKKLEMSNFDLNEMGHDLQSLTNLESLDLSHSSQLTDEIGLYFENLTSLKHLKLKDCSNLTDGIFLHLEKLTNLETLDVSQCVNFTHKIGPHLEKFIHLKGLNLNKCLGLTDKIGPSFEKLIHLEDLDISYCTKMTDKIFLSLKNLTNLLSLKLVKNRNLTNGIGPLLGELINLESLDLSHCIELTDEIVPHLKMLINLKNLNMSKCLVTDEIGPHLEMLINLKNLNMSRCLLTDEIGPFLGKLINLESLDLSNCIELTDEISQYLEKLTHLESLILLNTRVSHEVKQYLRKLNSNLKLQ